MSFCLACYLAKPSAVEEALIPPTVILSVAQHSRRSLKKEARERNSSFRICHIQNDRALCIRSIQNDKVVLKEKNVKLLKKFIKGLYKIFFLCYYIEKKNCLVATH